MYSPQAFSELKEIHAFIAKDSPEHAAGIIEAILKAVESLEEAPHRQLLVVQPKGKKRPIRSLPVFPYMVFFRVSDEDFLVEVLRIRHGAQRRLKRY